MGTTLIAAAVTPAGLEWVSVGDSPLFLLRDGVLKRLNADHSLRPVLREMSQRRELRAAESNPPSSGNLLRAALTGDEIALTDQSRRPMLLQEGDLILVATDGIHTLNDAEIVRACSKSATAEAGVLASHLLKAIRDRANPNQDNTTIAVLKPCPGADGLALPL